MGTEILQAAYAARSRWEGLERVQARENVMKAERPAVLAYIFSLLAGFLL
jgi:hypothetical protein